MYSCVYSNQCENNRKHKLHITEKCDVAIKIIPKILGSVKKGQSVQISGRDAPSRHSPDQALSGA